MGLFSDVDWLILLIAGGVLLLGGDNRELLRQAGRMYARFVHLRDDLLKDVKEGLVDEPKPAAATATAAAANPTPGLWSVGTARVVSPLSSEESQTSLASLKTLPGEPAVAAGGKAS